MVRGRGGGDDWSVLPGLVFRLGDWDVVGMERGFVFIVGMVVRSIRGGGGGIRLSGDCCGYWVHAERSGITMTKVGERSEFF